MDRYETKFYNSWLMWIVILILLGIFIIFIIIVASGENYYTNYRKESCKAYLSQLNGQLMRSIAENPEKEDELKKQYNQYVVASECTMAYVIQ